MKPILTKREIGEGIWHLRKAARLLAMIRAGELPAGPPSSSAPPRGFQEFAWREWVEVNANRFPAELVPHPNDFGLLAKLLDACAVTSIPNAVRRAAVERFPTTIVDVVRMPIVFLASETRGIPNLATGRIEALVCQPQARLWDATLLWTLAWWAAWGLKVRKEVGLLCGAWAIAGERLSDRLTIDEVWAARRMLIENL